MYEIGAEEIGAAPLNFLDPATLGVIATAGKKTGFFDDILGGGGGGHDWSDYRCPGMVPDAELAPTWENFPDRRKRYHLSRFSEAWGDRKSRPDSLQDLWRTAYGNNDCRHGTAKWQAWKAEFQADERRYRAGSDLQPLIPDQPVFLPGGVEGGDGGGQVPATGTVSAQEADTGPFGMDRQTLLLVGTGGVIVVVLLAIIFTN